MIKQVDFFLIIFALFKEIKRKTFIFTFMAKKGMENSRNIKKQIK